MMVNIHYVDMCSGGRNGENFLHLTPTAALLRFWRHLYGAWRLMQRYHRGPLSITTEKIDNGFMVTMSYKRGNCDSYWVRFLENSR
jgi:hypothetical protein